MIVIAACNAGAQPPRPNGIAIAPDGSLVVMALGAHQVVRLSPEGKSLKTFGKLGEGRSDIYEGWGTALDSVGNIYLCHRWRNEDTDVDYESIKVFNPRGRFIREIPTPGGNPEGCYAVHVDPQGRIFAVYNTTNQLRVFDAQGQLLSTLWGTTGTGPGEFYGLRDIALDPTRGALYASDASNSRIQRFDYEMSPAGAITATHRLTFGTYGRSLGKLAYPQYLAVDPATGHLAVGDMANRRVQIFDPEGRPLREFRPPDVDDWQVMGVAFAADGAVIAADALNGAIWIFEPDGRLRRRIELAA
jgi:DNA-binding beta-propeller fold protein YncE